MFRNTVKFIQPNANGTDYLNPTFVLNNGKVGIGTTSPDASLSFSMPVISTLKTYTTDKIDHDHYCGG